MIQFHKNKLYKLFIFKIGEGLDPSLWKSWDNKDKVDKHM